MTSTKAGGHHHHHHHDIPEDPFKGKASKNFDFRLSHDKLLEIKRVFDAFDDDLDGVIDIQHLGLAMRAGGLILTEKDVVRLTSEYDPDEKGVISLTTFFVLMARNMRDIAVIEDNVRKAFKKMSKATLISGADEVNLPTVVRNVLMSKGGDVLNETDMDDFMRDASQLADKGGAMKMSTLIKWVMREVPFTQLVEAKAEEERQAKEAKKSKKKAKG